MGPDCSLFKFILWGAIGGIICCFGFVGNLLSLIAFQRDRRSPTTTLLQCLASSDFILLLSVFITDALPYICSFTGTCDNPWDTWPYIRYIWILTPTSHMCSIWFVVLIAFNRYWAVCRPHTMSRVWHNQRTPVYVILVLFVVIIFNLPRFFEYTIQQVEVTTNSTTSVQLKENTTGFGNAFSYKVVYKVMLVNILLILLPIILLVVMTTLILRALRKTKRKMKQNRKSTKSGNGAVSCNKKRGTSTASSRSSTSEITVVLVMVVVVAIVCQTPLAVFHFVRYSFKYSCGQFVFYLNDISKLLVNINSCINFVIYCLFSRKFRKLLCTAFVCQAFTQVEPSTTTVRGKEYSMTPLAQRDT